MLVVDSHFFRGASVVALVSASGFEAELYCPTAATDESLIPSSNDPASLIIYIVGGASFLKSEHRSIATQLLQRSPEVPVVIVADDVSRTEIEAAVAMGVRGIVSTHMATDVAIAALRFVMAGGHYFPHSVLNPTPERQWVPHRLTTGTSEDAPRSEARATQSLALDDSRSLKFSTRQAEVLSGLERGLPNKAIAQELELCEATVKIHVRQVMRKLGVSNRTQVALWASTARMAGTVDA